MVDTLVGNSNVLFGVSFSTQALLTWLFSIAHTYVIGFFSTIFMLSATGVCVIGFVPVVLF